MKPKMVLVLTGLSSFCLAATLCATPVVIDVPMPEIPAKAAGVIAQTEVAERAAVTQEVIQQVVIAKPALAPFVVAAVGRTSPDMVAIAAATAGKIQSDAIVAIVSAAVKACPDRIQDIVTAMCQTTPAYASHVAVSAAAVSPVDEAKVLAGLMAAIPDLQPYVREASASIKTERSMEVLIKQTHALAQAAVAKQAVAARTAKPVELAPVGVDSTVATKVPAKANLNDLSIATASTAKSSVPAFNTTPVAGVALASSSSAPTTVASTVYASTFRPFLASPVYSAPRVGPPFTPHVTGGAEIGMGNTIVKPDGARDYSAP
jgi:hypothetical protein